MPRSPVQLRPPEPEPGIASSRWVDRYRLEGLIGEGAWGHVYDARDRATGDRVVIKMLRSEQLDARRFIRECALTARVNHPHVVRVLEASVDTRPAILVLEKIRGQTLREYLERFGRPRLAGALDVLDQIASALAAVHDAGVVHRDLKPSNVMVAIRGGRLHTKVIDFGLGKAADSVTITEAGYCVGTPGYIAPEQLHGAGGDARTDIYAWGALAYELLSGSPLVPPGNEIETLSAVLYGSPPPLSAMRSDVPHAISSIVMRALAKSPDERFPSAHRMRQALRSAFPL